MRVATFLGIGAMVLVSQSAAAKPFALTYGPYHRAGQVPGDTANAPTEAQIRSDIVTLFKYTDEIRTYAVDGPGLTVLKVCQEEGMAIHLGAYLKCEQAGQRCSGQNFAANRTDNGKTIAALLEAANRGHDVVQSLIVANELLLFKEITVPALVAYVNQVRTSNQHRYPLTIGETWYAGWVENKEMAKSVDFILFHMHPAWEGCGIDKAIKGPCTTGTEYLANAWAVMRRTFPNQRLVQGETGWPTQGTTRGANVPSVANQKKFITDLRAWVSSQTKQTDIYLFEAFDEPWKTDEGSAGPYWGVLTSTGAPKSDAIPARLVPMSASDAGSGKITVTLDGPATGDAAAVVRDAASWELTGGTITGAALSGDGKTVTLTYTGGDAFRGVRATESASDVIARRRFALGAKTAYPVVPPNAADNPTPTDAGVVRTDSGTSGGVDSGTAVDQDSGVVNPEEPPPEEVPPGEEGRTPAAEGCQCTFASPGAASATPFAAVGFLTACLALLRRRRSKHV